MTFEDNKKLIDVNKSESGCENEYDYWNNCFYIVQGNWSIRYHLSYDVVQLSIILWEFPHDHVLENTRSCLKDILQINNSVE